MNQITFGTSGWRAVIAEEFTFDNVLLCVQGICDHLKDRYNGQRGEVIVGYDTRFLSKEFAGFTAGILKKNGFIPLLTDRDAPTPVISSQIQHRGALGGINFTASHNPYRYNGIKFSPSHGGPAEEEVTRDIECKIAAIDQDALKRAMALITDGECRAFDPRPEYIERLNQKIDFQAISSIKEKLYVDCLHGTARGYLDTLLAQTGCSVESLHADLNPFFGGSSPEPSDENLGLLKEKVRSTPGSFGLAADGDADRFGIIDQGGCYVTNNNVLLIVMDHLRRNKKYEGVVVRSAATTRALDALARHYGIEIVETPVGFKHIGAVIARQPVIVGGEESGGLSIGGHVPEKDGILACLLMAEAFAMNGKNFSQTLNDIFTIIGPFYNARINIGIDSEKREAILAYFRDWTRNLADLSVVSFRDSYGLEYMTADGSWFMLRGSGTEPIVRCYIETREPHKMEILQNIITAKLKGV